MNLKQLKLNVLIVELSSKNTKENNYSSFWDYMLEDKSKYKKASECGWYDPYDYFLVGDSGGFLFNMDFTFVNTHLLTEVAEYYRKNGCYTKHPAGSLEYKQFRLREEERRRNGFTANCKLQNGKIKPLRITGEQYNFINYGRMNRVVSTTNKRVGRKAEDFPSFFGNQFWWAVTKEFAKNNGFNVVNAKSRRAGYTYQEACDSANDVNLTPKITILHTASSNKYLFEGHSFQSMVLNQILFYENETPFKRGLLHQAKREIELGFKQKNGTRAGFQSKILAEAFIDNPDVAIGKDAFKIKIDEMANAPGLEKFMHATMSTTEAGTLQTGMIIGFGAAGSEEGGWQDFEQWFYAPQKYNAMPFENVWDEGKRDTICGFFKPYWWDVEGFDEDGNTAVDEFGNTNFHKAIKVIELQKEKERKKSIKDFMAYCSNHPNTPSEMFLANNENPFTSPELTQHIDNVKHNSDYKGYEDGMIVLDDKKGYVFKSNERLKAEGCIIHKYIEEVPFRKDTDVSGCIRLFAPPYKQDGYVPNNLYRIWADPVGIDKEKDKIVVGNSLNCYVVYMRENNIVPNDVGDRIVAVYTGRRELMSDDNRILLGLANYYNATILAEVDRGQIVNDFRQWGKLNMLSYEPNVVWDNALQSKTGKRYGISMGSGSSNRRLAGIGYLKDWLYTERGMDEFGNMKYNLHCIYDLSTLLEIQKWRPNGNFDRVSALLVGMYDIKELSTEQLRIKTFKESHNFASVLKQFYSR